MTPTARWWDNVARRAWRAREYDRALACWGRAQRMMSADYKRFLGVA